MAERHDTMIDPPIEELLGRAGSKFSLVALASTRARQINNYVHQLGRGHGSSVPPQVTTTASKPLSVAFEEIAADKILPVNAPGVENPEGYVPPAQPEAADSDDVAGE